MTVLELRNALALVPTECDDHFVELQTRNYYGEPERCDLRSVRIPHESNVILLSSSDANKRCM